MESLVTYLTTCSKYFFPKKIQALPASDEWRKASDLNPESTGLVNNPIVRLRTQRSKCIGKLITGHIPILLLEINNIPIVFRNEKVTTIAKKLKEEQSEKQFLENNKELIESLNKENNQT